MKEDSHPDQPWSARLNRLVDRLASADKGALATLFGWLVRGTKGDRAYLRANSDAIQRTVRGMGPDNEQVDPGAGARMVVNISSVHVPAFCAASRNGDLAPYKNAYDIEQLDGGGATPPIVSERRMLVDSALPLPAGQAPQDTYFGAVELNGAGIRFYGDICLVLRPDRVPSGTVLLDRNSYDVLRAPARDAVERMPKVGQASERKAILRRWSGQFKRDVGAIVAIKTLNIHGAVERRLTTGQISEAARDDEDYVEVLRRGSFSAGDLQEARLAAGEAAHDALVSSRLHMRPTPRLEALIWRDRRREAERSLRACGVPVRVVTTTGRTRG